MTDYMVEGLAKKRAELAGEIERTQDALHKLVTDLEHIDATLRIIAPDMEIEAIRPKVFTAPEDWSRRGEMARVCLSILRTARDPMTSREIAAQMVIQRGMAADQKMLKLMTKRVSTCLKRQRDLGRAVSEDGPGFHLLWVIKR
tara:strand:+ start:86 stop:517 length:432 start_codon:yes stop_codon:yes gene_type:complete